MSKTPRRLTKQKMTVRWSPLRIVSSGAHSGHLSSASAATTESNITKGNSDVNREKMLLWVSTALDVLQDLAPNRYMTEYERLRLFKTNDGHADHVFSLGDLLDVGYALATKVHHADQDNGNDDLVKEVIAYVGLAANAKEII